MNSASATAKQWIVLTCLCTLVLTSPFSLNAHTTQEEAQNNQEECVTQQRTIQDPFYPIDYSLYFLKSFDPYYNTITLHDSSIWSIRPSEAYLISSWYDESTAFFNYDGQPSKIYFTQNTDYLFDGPYSFCMVNRDTGAYVHCNIIASAPLDTVNKIYYLDWLNGYMDVISGNGAIAQFSLHSSDFLQYFSWSPNQRIVIVRTHKSGYAHYPYTLVNLDTLNSVRCRLY